MKITYSDNKKDKINEWIESIKIFCQPDWEIKFDAIQKNQTNLLIRKHIKKVKNKIGKSYYYLNKKRISKNKIDKLFPINRFLIIK